MRIRELQEKDAALMLEWMHDPDVNRWFKNEFCCRQFGDSDEFYYGIGR